MMDDSTLIYLLAGALRADSPSDVDAIWQHRADTIERGTLAEALESVSGRVRVVLSAGDVLLTSVELSRRQARHIQKVLPYLLEESLLSSTDEMWFAHGRPVDSHYPVAACERDGLEQLLAWFDEASDVQLAGAWVDADLLQPHAPCLVWQDAELLCVPSPGQAAIVPHSELAQLPQLLGIETEEFMRIEHPEALLTAFREALGSGAGVALLHGDLRPTVQQGAWSEKIRPWRPLAGLAAGVLVAVWGLLLAQQWQLNRAAEARAAEAVAMYQELFPGAPRPQLLQREFRTQLERMGGSAAGGGFLSLMTPVGEILGGATDQA